ncbi:MAG: helix-turn-helix transcriptional regulator [Halioglobus sp.]
MSSYRWRKLLLIIAGGTDMEDYRKANKSVDMTVGDSVRVVRELQERSQNELSELTGIPRSTISAIENDRINPGNERAKVLALALNCHPAVLVFPGWDVESSAA